METSDGDYGVLGYHFRDLSELSIGLSEYGHELFDKRDDGSDMFDDYHRYVEDHNLHVAVRELTDITKNPNITYGFGIVAGLITVKFVMNEAVRTGIETNLGKIEEGTEAFSSSSLNFLLESARETAGETEVFEQYQYETQQIIDSIVGIHADAPMTAEVKNDIESQRLGFVFGANTVVHMSDSWSKWLYRKQQKYSNR